MKTTDKYKDKYEALNDARIAIDILMRKDINVPFLDLVKDGIMKRLTQVEEHIKDIRSSCNHNWEWSCSGHNGDAYVCTICGAVDRR